MNKHYNIDLGQGDTASIRYHNTVMGFDGNVWIKFTLHDDGHFEITKEGKVEE